MPPDCYNFTYMHTDDTCALDYKEAITQRVEGTTGLEVLDVGCGTGSMTVLLNVRKNKVYGTDIENRTLKQFRDRFTFFLSSEDKINTVDAKFDLITSFDVIEHVDDDSLFVQEVYRALKPGGKTFHLTPNRNRLTNFVRRLIGKKVEYPLDLGTDPKLGPVIHVREYDRKMLSDLFSKTGFNDVTVRPFWFGVRHPFIERVRLREKIPFPLSELAQYWIVTARKD